MSDVELNWSTASVKDAKLSVELEGEIPDGWKQSFEATARLLGKGDWGKVRLKKHAVQVEQVTPGGEDKLRHFLESVLDQANADHAAPDEDERDDDDDGEGEERSSDDDGPDAQMTEQFRSFGERA